MISQEAELMSLWGRRMIGKFRRGSTWKAHGWRTSGILRTNHSGLVQGRRWASTTLVSQSWESLIDINRHKMGCSGRMLLSAWRSIRFVDRHTDTRTTSAAADASIKGAGMTYWLVRRSTMDGWVVLCICVSAPYRHAWWHLNWWFLVYDSTNSISSPAVWVYIRDVYYEYYHRGHRLIGAVATPHGDNLSWWAGDISSGERKHKDEEGERKKARDGPSRFPLGVKFHEKLNFFLLLACLLFP